MKRDWRQANRKRDVCRICGAWPTELAHVIGRAYDQPKEGRATKWVNPDSVVPLCKEHHERYDARALDLLPVLSPGEQAQAVRDAGGIEAARRRVIGPGDGKKRGAPPDQPERNWWACPNCGAQIPLSASLCLLCGYLAPNEGPTQELENP